MHKDYKPVNLIIKKTKARFEEKDVQIFFQEKRDPVTGQRLQTKEPVTLFINNAGPFNEFPVECIQDVKVKFVGKPTWTCLCGNRIRITVPFKVFLLVQFADNSYDLITLPDDIGVKVTTLYDLTEKQISRSILQTMQIVGNVFVYTITIPVDDFTGVVPADTLFTVVTRLRNMTWNADIGAVCFCGTSSPPVPATTVDLAIFFDLIVQVVVEDELTVLGELE
ncbi:MAG: hypothetical protein GX184_05235 [Clostridiaceae bacterium]|nr:hypothetical protein [Clostridiaceae bacterium]